MVEHPGQNLEGFGDGYDAALKDLGGNLRVTIFDQINKERASQDEKWSNREQYVYNAPHLLILETKINRMRAMWYEGQKEDLKAEWIKIAAIAIRALEEVK